MDWGQIFRLATVFHSFHAKSVLIISIVLVNMLLNLNTHSYCYLCLRCEQKLEVYSI